jgi:hypothetical protein
MVANSEVIPKRASEQCGWAQQCVGHQRWSRFSMSDKSIAPYRQCSAAQFGTAKDFGASIVDTAICTKPFGLWQDNCF